MKKILSYTGKLALVCLLCLLGAGRGFDIAASSTQGEETLGLYDSFQTEGDIRRFAGETIYFDISFLWFKNAAMAKISFLEENGHYYSILEAQTKGFVGWFTTYRKHVYKAYFDIVDGGKRVRSSRFDRSVIVGDHAESVDHLINYITRKHTWSRTPSREAENKSEDIPDRVVFDDILATFYNFRNGVYGKLEKGAEFKVFTIPEKGVNTLLIQIKNDRETKAAQLEEGRHGNDELLLRVVIPKELFKTKNGELYFWGSKHFVPLETTVKEYILLGDLHAKFVKREQSVAQGKSFSTVGDAAPR